MPAEKNVVEQGVEDAMEVIGEEYGGLVRVDGFQARGRVLGDFELSYRVRGRSHHPDVAITPGLCRNPLDDVVGVVGVVSLLDDSVVALSSFTIWG